MLVSLVLLVLLAVTVNAFISSPALVSPSVRGSNALYDRPYTSRSSYHSSSSSMGMTMNTKSAEPSELAGNRMWLNFAAFGFSNRTCQLTIEKSGDCVFGEGLITREPGQWRLEVEDGIDYFQFSCPLTELYSEIYDVPSGMMFWRAKMNTIRSTTKEGKEELVKVELTDGVIISEKKSFMGMKTDFVEEGQFAGRTLMAKEPFPEEVPLFQVSLEEDDDEVEVKSFISRVPDLAEYLDGIDISGLLDRKLASGKNKDLTLASNERPPTAVVKKPPRLAELERKRSKK